MLHAIGAARAEQPRRRGRAQSPASADAGATAELTFWPGTGGEAAASAVGAVGEAAGAPRTPRWSSVGAPNGDVVLVVAGGASFATGGGAPFATGDDLAT